MNVLFAMGSPEYLRFYDTTIQLLAARGHHVFVAISVDKEKKPVRLEGLGGVGGRVTAVGLVPERGDLWEPIARGLRGTEDFARYLHPRFAAAPALRARMKRKALPRAFYPLDTIRTLGVSGTRLLLRALAALERAIPSSPAIEAFIREQHADLVLVSPLVDAASDQVDLVKAAHALGIPTAVCIASWDNLTNKGQLRVQPDRVIVWNEAQRREAVEYHGTSPGRAVATGAQLFDRWFERTPGTTREAFCRRAGLPSDRPFVLFTCSSSFISISHAEVGFVRAWVGALRAHPALADVPVLVRPHPYNFAAWETADFADLPDVAIWPDRPYNPVGEESRTTFFDTIYHSGAVVGINTSAMIEAAIVGRPVLSVVAGEFAAKQEGTLHFHYLLPENGGFVRFASTLHDHVAQLEDVLVHPDEARAQTQRFVSSFIRPHGLDVPCTPLVVDTIESLGDEAHVAESLPWWAPVLWPVLLVGGAAAGAWWLVVERKVRRGARKKLGAAWRRTRKYSSRVVRLGRNRVTKGVRRLRKQWT